MRVHLPRSKKGVSEIIATLLTLSITVILFTGLFIWVYKLPGPEQNVHSDFEATFEISNGVGFLNITHVGGEKMDSYATRIFIFVNRSPVAQQLTLADGGVVGDWEIGETWRYSSTNISCPILEVSIVDINRGVRVWNTAFGLSQAQARPIIYSVIIQPETVAQGENVTFSAYVFDPDGLSDVTNVWVNLSSLGGPAQYPLTDPDGEGVYSATYTLPLAAPVGQQMIVFGARDSSGLEHQRTAFMRVLSSADRLPVISFQKAEPNPVWEEYYFNVSARVVDPQDDLAAVWVVSNPEIPGLSSNVSMAETEIADVFRTGNGVLAPIISPNYSYRNYTITIHAEDVFGHASDASFTLTVVNSSTPIINWAISEPTTVVSGSYFKLRASVSDQENDVTRVWANLSEMGLGDVNLTAQGTVYETGLISSTSVVPGDYNVTFYAIDALNHSALPYTITIRVLNATPGVEEVPPIITSVTVQYNPVVTGTSFRVQAKVIDLNGNLNTSDVKVDLSAISMGVVYLNDTGDHSTFISGNITAPSPPSLPAEYVLIVWANDTLHTDNGSWAYTILRVIAKPGELVNPDISLQQLVFSDDNPVHASNTVVTITLWALNVGGVGNATNAVGHFVFIDHSPEGDHVIGHVNATVYQSPTPIFIDWHPLSGGLHVITARLLNSTPPEDVNASLNNNEISKNITVSPSILLVDDDHAPRDGSMWDCVSWMVSAIDAAGFGDALTIYTVSGTDGPPFDTGNVKLIDFDIVIWMTGYETSNLLTSSDRTNLEQFLSLNRSLWLISEGAMNDPAIQNWRWGGFGDYVLHVDPASITTDGGPADPVIGDMNHTVAAGRVYNISSDRGPYSRGDYIAPDSSADIMFYDSNGVNAISYNGSYKLVFFSWEFSKILYTSDQADLAYRVIRWLGGLTTQTGEDIAVSQIAIEPQVINYRDNLTITAVLRNNGLHAWNVKTAFYLDGQRLSTTDSFVYASKTVDTVYLEPGEQGIVYMTLRADFDPGYHVISVMADPDNDIEEVNELNNIISTDNPIFNLTIYVRFTLLIVDDDGSANNGGTLYNVTANLTAAIDYLGYNYTLYVVNPVGADGPSAKTLSEYKAVIWMCGATNTDTLTTNDQIALRDYITNQSGELWLVGQDILWDLTDGGDGEIPNGTFARDILHVKEVYHNEGTPDPVSGVLYDSITHGMKYQTDSSLVFTDRGDRIVPDTARGAHGIFWQDVAQSSYNALAWTNNDTGARVVFMPWEYAFISGLYERPLPGTPITRGTIWYDGFETGDLSGGPWTKNGYTNRVDVSNLNPHTGSYSLQYKGGSFLGIVYWASVETTKDLGAATTGTLTFWWTSTKLDSGEFGALDISPDGGNTWYTDVRNIYGTTAWTQETVDLSPYLPSSNLVIRFYFKANSNNEKIYVDDVAIDVPTGPQITAISVDPDPTNEAQTVTLYVTAQADAGLTVTDMEYWSDVDSNHYPMDPDDGAFDSQIEDGHKVVDVSTWSAGNHTFYVRAKDSSGKWGDPVSVNFEVVWEAPATITVSATPNPTNEQTTINLTATVSDKYSTIQAVEYFFEGQDQGAGNNPVMHPTDGAFDNGTEDAYVIIDISGLDPGTYHIFVRAQDSNGIWNVTGPSLSNYSTYVNLSVSTTPPVTSNVQVTPDPTNGATSVSVTADVYDSNSLIQAAEAFIDTDPGEGNGTPLTVPSHNIGDTVTVFGTVPITGYSQGVHVMYVRAQQASDGAWGAPAGKVFQITEPDTTGPDVVSVDVTPNPTAGALTVSLTAVIRDDQSTVAAAEYFVDTYGAGGTGTPMDPTDGSFNSQTESANITIDVSGWAYGTYTLYVRGQDSEGNWGPVSSITLTVSRPPVEEALACRSELAFMVLKYFEYPEERPELRVVSVDINITGRVEGQVVHPMLGESYLVSAEVYNNGGANATTRVRLLDGNNIITTQTVFIPAHSKVRVEGIWTPLIVGNRKIIADITPISNEVFGFNNIAYRSITTYFFYDDMESGTGKWSHDGTVLLINGESPLDFMDSPVNSTIVSTWAHSDFNSTTNDSHSYPTSFFVRESSGPITGTGRVPMDVAIVMDTSGSMDEDPDGDGKTKFDNAVEAAQTFVGMLHDDDRITVFHFSGEKPAQKQPFVWATEGGKNSVNNSIKSLVTGDWTPIWDTIGEAITYVLNNPRQPGDPGYGIPGEDYLQVVIALTDGDDWGTAGRETGSETYCPGSDTGTDYQYSTWGWPTGLKWGDTAVDFDAQGGTTWGGSNDVQRYYSSGYHWLDIDDTTRTGLLYAPLLVYTIGIGMDPQASDPSAPGEYLSNTSAEYRFTTEYDLKRIAETSSQGGKNGEYFYNSNGTDLTDIFVDIYYQASSPGVVTRSEDTTTQTTGTRSNSTIKYAETETFSLVGVDHATLSFYHKYNLKLGYNGGVIMVGNSTDGVNFTYKYVIPKESYPGNLFLQETEYDDYNNVVRWCYNGVSAGGTFDWEYSEVDLTPFVGSQYVRVKFVYYDYGGGNGGGWWIDDVKVTVSRGDNTTVTHDAWDQWYLTTDDSVSGIHSWHNVDPRGYFKGGLDNSLYTQPIDLTNALHATLSAYFKFNINSTGGRPPDTFRVEVSDDNGVTWHPLSLGVRACRGVSGYGDDMDDGVQDGKSFTGLDPDGDGWVAANTLTRLNVDLSGWIGKTVILRFRVVTPSDDNSYFGSNHYEIDPATGVWGGFYIDDVIVYGVSIQGG